MSFCFTEIEIEGGGLGPNSIRNLDCLLLAKQVDKLELIPLLGEVFSDVVRENVLSVLSYVRMLIHCQSAQWGKFILKPKALEAC